MLEHELRPVFYDRQDVTNVDLNQIFAYDDDAWRAHNRAFHGCGIVCGLEVRREEREGRAGVIVTPGYALSATGDEIDVRREAWLAIDCATPLEADCLHEGEDSSGGPLSPAYIVLRPAERLGRRRPLAPAPCAERECVPTRVCPGYEIACSPTAPAACPPPFNLNPLCAERLIHGALSAGDLGATGLFGCVAAADDAITLARVEFDPQPNGPPTPRLVFDDRAYVPALRFLFDLARMAGAQTLKRPYTIDPAISFLDEPPVRRLSLNRGVELAALAVRGRGFLRVISATASSPEIDITDFSRVPGPQEDRRGTLALRVPLLTTVDTFSLHLETDDGRVFPTDKQIIPIVIDLHDNPLEDIPIPRNVPWRFNLERLRNFGYTTAQQLAAVEPRTLMRRYNNQSRPADLLLAAKFIDHIRAWLRDGAPGAP